MSRLVSAAVATAPRLGRAQGAQHPRRDRADLVVGAVHRGPGGHGPGQPAAAGRNYARRGQVISLDVDAGAVTAQVQGSRARPYKARIGIAAFGKAEWAQVEQALAENAWYTAKLLAGEMPEDIEDVFAELGLSLFPAAAGGSLQYRLDSHCWQAVPRRTQ